jgi:hypothetical protein
MFAATTEYMPPPGMNGFLANVMYVCCIIAAIAVAWRSIFPREGKSMPQPVLVKGSTRMATHEELVQLRTEFENFKIEQRTANTDLKKAIEHAVQAINEAGERRIAAIHERINNVAVGVAEMKGELKNLK